MELRFGSVQWGAVGATAARRPRRRLLSRGSLPGAVRAPPPACPAPGSRGTVSSDPLSEHPAEAARPPARAAPKLLGSRRHPPVPLSPRLSPHRGGGDPGAAGRSAPPPGAHTPPSCRRVLAGKTLPGSRDAGARVAGRSRGGGRRGPRGDGGGALRGGGRPPLPSCARPRICVYPFKKEPLER